MSGKAQKSILLVEDEVLISLTEKMQLEKFGYKVTTANTGEKAVDTFKDGHAIDLVLMDINLGSGIDGTEAAQLILDDRDVPIVFVSSHTEPEVVEKTEKITSYGYVVKSSSITVLDASIKMAFKLFEANKKVKESESQYHALVEGMPGIVYSFSSKRGGLFYSSSATEILGNTPEQLLADPLLWQNSIHEDDRPRIKEVIANSGNGAPFQIEYRIRDARGGWHLFDDRSFGARDTGDEVIVDGLALDITSMRQAEEEIHARDIRLRKLFENIPDLVFQFTRRPDGNYHVPIASQGIKNIFGCSPEDVLEDFGPISRVIHPEDAARVIADIEYSAEHLSYFTCEFRVILPGKGVQWIYSRSSPERLPDGSVTWHGFNANITETKLKEQETERAKAILQASIESPKDLIIMAIDRDYRYLCFNTAHSKAMEAAYGKEVAVGINVLDCMTSHEDIVNAKGNYDRALRGESHSTLQEYGDLEKTFFESHYNPIYNDRGEVIGITVFARDTTERKLMETRLRETNEYLQNLFDYANAPIIVWDSELKITRFNHAFEALTGREAPDVLGKPLNMLFPPDQVPSSLGLIDRTKGGEHLSVVEIDIQHMDGSIRTVLWNSATIFDSEGLVPVAVIAQGQDITERKRAEAELRESYDTLRLFVRNSPIYSFIKEVEPGKSRTIAASENYKDLLGVPGSKMVGLTMEELFPPEFAAKITADDWRVASGDEILRLDEKLGDRQYTTIKFPISIGGKRLLGGYSIDITDNKPPETASRESEE
jgi:PAS domain S-box-containing protein